jgi:hypothetical protein
VGSWKVPFEDGSLELGQWRKGEPVGRWELIAADGRVAEEGRYDGGFPTGGWTCRDADGSSFSGRFVDGLRVGDWVRLDAEGREVEVVRYDDDPERVPLHGRGWRGGLLVAQGVPSPCSEDPNRPPPETP